MFQMAEVVNKENLNPQQNLKDSSHSDTVLADYMNKIQHLEDAITKLNEQINQCKNDKSAKENCIKTAVQDLTAQEDCIKEYKKHLNLLDIVIKDNCEKYSERKQLMIKNFEEKQAKLTAKQSDYLEIVKKHDFAKSHIMECQTREDQLVTRLQSSEAQLASLCTKYASLEKQQKDSRPCEEAIESNEELLKEIATMESVIRRLTIKTTAQQSELKRKDDECKALSALCEDITAHN